MKKLIIVFCLVTMLTLLFACNGVPALAETDDTNNNTTTPAAIEQTAEESVVNNVSTPTAIEQATKNGANTETSKPEKAKKKAKKKVKTVDIMKYVKKGVFDYYAYKKAIKASGWYYSENGYYLNYRLNTNYIIEISTHCLDRSKKKYYVGIGFFTNKPLPYSEITYASYSEKWGKSISLGGNIYVSKDGLLKLQKIVDYVRNQKAPDPYKKPKIKGIKWIDGKEIDNLFDWKEGF
ncbi:hypothetical protein EUA78_00680 [TM7 phylum sp. oral taxon 351]|nr:hypothetical protein EUA78_00680 [TM7 phylum sp. oral taxon 351]